MKKKFQFLQHLVSLLLVVTMLSQTTSVKAVDEIQPGVDYYIMNVETDLFLGAQNFWGTQATLSEDAGIFRFVPGTTGEGYNIVNTLVSMSNKNLGTNLYTDNNGLATVKDNGAAGTTKSIDGIWTWEDKGGGIFAFRCVSEWKWENDAWVETPHGYLCKSETAGYRKGFELMFSQELTDNCLFRVMTYDEALEYMVDKAQSSNVSFNFLIKNPDFCRNNSTAAWTVSADCTNKILAGGNNNNMCAESYHSTFTISQIVKDLPAGRYQLSAQGFYRQDGGDNDNMPYAFVGPAESPIAKAMIPLKTGSENSMTDASNSFTDGKYTIDPIRFNLEEKTDLEIGFQCKNKTMWVIWDNIQLMSYSNVAEYGQEMLTEINKTYPIEGLASADVRAAYDQAYSDFSNFVANITPGTTTFDDVDAEYDKFTAAETALKASIESWSGYDFVVVKAKKLYTQITSQEYYTPSQALYALNSYVNADASDYGPGSIANGYVFINGNYNYITPTTALDEKEIAAEVNFVNRLLNDVARSTAYPGMDATFLLVNADFKDTNVGYGWTRQSSGSVNWNIRSGLSGWPVSETYIPGNGSTFDIFQVVEGAPAGLYKVTVNAFHRPAGSWDAETKVPVALYMGTIANPIQNIAKDPIINDLVWSDEEQKYLDGEVAKNGTNCYFWDGNSAKDDAAKAAIWAGNQNPDPEIQALISSSTSLTGAGKYNSDSQYNESYLIPNGMDGASIAFSAGRYPMVVCGEVPDEGDGVGTLRIGLKSTEPLNDGAWTLWGGFRMQYLGGAAQATEIIMSQTELNIPGYLNTHQLQATVQPAGAMQIVRWSSSDESVATVDANGLVTAISEGNATITATTIDGTNLSATCAVSVTIPTAASVVLNQTEIKQYVGETYRMQATVLPEGSAQTVTWFSSNPEVATVNKNGLVTAVAEGTVTITATTTDGTDLSATCEVTVMLPPVVSVTLNREELVRLVGETFQLQVTVLPAEALQVVTWLTSNPEVVTVDETGLVTAVAEGTATITATTTDGTELSATCEVTVAIPASSVTLDQSELQKFIGETCQLQATVLPEAAIQNVIWLSSNPEVATVDETGLVTAVGSGAATITATTTDGTELSATCEVNVTIPPATSVTFNKAVLFTTAGETYRLKAKVLPVEACQTITWQSSNPEVATVDETGLVTAVGNGNATVTATTTDGTELFANCSVKVMPVVISGMCGNNVRYTLYDDMSLLISGTGDMTSSPWTASYSKDIKTVIIEEGVTKIVYAAFWDCSGITSVTIPTSMTSIDQYAFEGCRGLTSIMIPEGVTSIGEKAFENCSGLTSISIPEGVTRIDGGSFNGCSSLTSVTIPESMKNIGSYAFQSCSGLTSITIPDGVTSIGDGAFRFCSGLTKAEFASIERLCNISFENEDANPLRLAHHLYIDGVEVIDVVIPESVTSIGNYAFQGCSGLTSVTIPNSVTSIGQYAFYNCSGLTSITIPNRVTSIGTNALNATNLCEIKLQGNTPGTKGNDAFNADAFFYVPSEALDAYKTAWSDIADRIFTVDALTPEVTESTATDGKSALLDAIGGIGQESSIVSLKVRGSLNGYDIMLIRNKMTNLRYLDLSEARIVKEANNYEYYTGCYTEDDVLGANSFRDLQLLKVVLPKDITSIGEYAFSGCAHLLEVKGMPATCQTIGSYAFSSCSTLREVEIGSGVASIGYAAFSGCSSLTSVTIPNSVTNIGGSAFSSCSALKDIVFSRNLERIESYAFSYCRSLQELKLPASLKYIGGSAFEGCSSLKEVHIPSMMESIADGVFTSNSITDVYAYSLSPISIGQNTFNYNATLHAPQTPESVFNAYYYNTQWSQFTSVVDFQAEYSSWYAPEDYDIVVESGEEIPSEDKETGANGEMQPGSGLIYEDGSSQKLDELSMIWEDGKNYPSLIHNEDVDINSLSITLNVQKNKWYFFCFPFDIDLTTATYPSKHYVWRWYDGDERALHGVGGWKNTVGNTLTAGQGYIFQTNKDGELVLHIANPELGNGDTEVDLEAHDSGEVQDANWNFVGNKNLSYYDINTLTEEFQSPITVWDAENGTYTAIVPGDDEYSFHPYEAFFVQKPDEMDKITFDGEGRETFSQKQQKEAEARAMVKESDNSNNPRKIINLTISDGAKTDKTRVVFNDERSESYEQECDASKFLSSGVPQIYTMDAKSVKYAINERVKGAGAVNIGYVASEAGSYVIRAQRMDCPMALKDNVTGAVWKLSEGAYSFNTEAGTHEARFTLIPADEATSVNEVKTLGELSLSSVGGGIAVKGLNGKSLTVYSLGGAAIATVDADGMVSLPAGVYVVSCDGKTVKMSVR